MAANQRTPEDEHETFELHFDSDRRRWQVTNKQGCYWSLSGGNVAASGSTGTDLELHWQSDGTCCFQVFPPEVTSSDRRWICARKSGQLFAGAAVSAPAARFWIQIWNRPRITLRPLSSLVNTNVVTTANGAFGFVGIRTNTSNRLDCSHIVPQNIELILVEQPFESFESSQSSALPDIGQSSKIESELLSLTNQTPTAICYCLRQCQNRKFWNLDAKQLVACASDDLAEAQRWLFEFRAPNELTIRAFGQKNAYITLNAQGLLQVVHCEPTNAFVWDF